MEGNSGYGRLRQAPPAAIHIRYTKFLQLAPLKLKGGEYADINYTGIG